MVANCVILGFVDLPRRSHCRHLAYGPMLSSRMRQGGQRNQSISLSRPAAPTSASVLENVRYFREQEVTQAAYLPTSLNKMKVHLVQFVQRPRVSSFGSKEKRCVSRTRNVSNVSMIFIAQLVLVFDFNAIPPKYCSHGALFFPKMKYRTAARKASPTKGNQNKESRKGRTKSGRWSLT